MSSSRNGPTRTITGTDGENGNGQARANVGGSAVGRKDKIASATKATKKAKQAEVQYLVELKYSNTLPEVPFEPKFLKINFPRDRFYKYKEKSSLEQSYQYRIHIEPDIGPPIHLIDPISASIPNVKLAEEDRALLRDDDGDGRTTSSFFKRPGAEEKLPGLKKFVQNAERARVGKSWLLKTQYLDNNLHKSVHNYTSEADNVRRKRAEFEKELKEQLNQAEKPMKQRILESFQFANSDALPVHRNKSLKPVKVFNVLPSLQLCENEYFHVVFDGKNILPENIKKESGAAISKKEKIMLYHNRLFTKGNNVALLLPVEMEKVLGDDEDDNNPKEPFNLKRLREVREFKYNVRNYNTNERFAFVWDAAAAKEKEEVKIGSVRFLRLEEAGLEMKRVSTSAAVNTGRKRPRKEKQPQEYNLKERELNDEEKESRKVRKTELTEGTYEDSDDDEEETNKKNDNRDQSPAKTTTQDISSDSSSSGSGSDSDSS